MASHPSVSSSIGAMRCSSLKAGTTIDSDLVASLNSDGAGTCAPGVQSFGHIIQMPLRQTATDAAISPVSFEYCGAVVQESAMYQKVARMQKGMQSLALAFCSEPGSSRNWSVDFCALATLSLPNHCSVRLTTQHSTDDCEIQK